MDVFYLLIGIFSIVIVVVLIIIVFKKLENGERKKFDKIVPGSIFKHVITYNNPFFEDDCFYVIVVDIRENKKGVKYVKYKTLYEDIVNESWRVGSIEYKTIEKFVDYYDNETDLIYKDDKVIKSC